MAPRNLQTSYWELATDAALLAREATGVPRPKLPKQRTRVGQRFDRIDIPSKVFGEPSFLRDMRMPDLVHGRVVRPPQVFAKLEDVREHSQLPDTIKIVRDGSFLGVVAETEAGACRAAAAISACARWHDGESLPDDRDLGAWMRQQVAVLRAAAVHADWATYARCEGRGQGIAFARYKNNGAYCAVVAEVEVDQDVRVRHLVCATDAGEVINPDGLINQIEGGAIQSTSWTLKEAVHIDLGRIASDSWDAYPILRFSEVPRVDVVVLDHPAAPSLGAGEASQGPVAAAIANAVADAVGTRVRHLPLSREALIASLG